MRIEGFPKAERKEPQQLLEQQEQEQFGVDFSQFLKQFFEEQQAERRKKTPRVRPSPINKEDSSRKLSSMLVLDRVACAIIENPKKEAAPSVERHKIFMSLLLLQMISIDYDGVSFVFFKNLSKFLKKGFGRVWAFLNKIKN
jgi:hypothetical protein